MTKKCEKEVKDFHGGKESASATAGNVGSILG